MKDAGHREASGQMLALDPVLEFSGGVTGVGPDLEGRQDDDLGTERLGRGDAGLGAKEDSEGKTGRRGR